MQFSGVLNNCYCKAGSAGFVGFEDAAFYRSHYKIDESWTAGAVLGIIPAIVCAVASLGLLMYLKPLWQAAEHQDPSRSIEPWAGPGSIAGWLL